MTSYTPGADMLLLTPERSSHFNFRSVLKPLTGGGYVLVYENWGATNYSPGSVGGKVHAQLFDATGSAVGSDLVLTPTDGIYHEFFDVQAVADGGFSVSWSNGTGDIYSQQRFGSDGTAIGDATHALGGVLALSDGGFVSVGSTPYIAGNDDVVVQFYDAGFQPIGAQVTVNAAGAHSRYVEDYTELNDGKLVVVWNSDGQDGDSFGVFTQLFDSSGARIGVESQVNTQTAGEQFVSRVVALRDGGYVVAWWNMPSNGLKSQTLLQRYDGEGHKVGEEVQVNGTDSWGYNSSISALADGGYVLAYQGLDSNFHSGLFIQQFDINGAKLGPETFLNSDSMGGEIDALADGSFVVKWEVMGGPTVAIYERTFTPSSPLPVFGDHGDNSLDGSVGPATVMYGLAGDDSYFVDDVADQAIESIAGVDTGGYDIVASMVSYYLGDNVEELLLIGSGNLYGSGNSSDNFILGNDGNNQLYGWGGDDELVGGLGSDTLNGGDGYDIANYSGASRSVTVSLLLQDQVQVTGSEGSDYLTGIEGLTGSQFGDVLIGDDNGNQLDGGAGNDTMTGGAGDDDYIVEDAGDKIVETLNSGFDWVVSLVSYTLGDNLEKLTLISPEGLNGTGNGLANILNGNSRNNVLDGRAGADTMAGRTGNDTYSVDNVGDVVIELVGGGTSDTVKTDLASYTLGANVENLILVGSGNINGTGNELSNLIIGNGADNVLTGGKGDDTLTGGKGDDMLVSGTGADRMIGGDGNDTYQYGADDTIVEAANGGIDTVLTSLAMTNLGPTLENVTLIGSALNANGNGLANIMIGNGLNNILQGGNGADTIDGRAGADTLNGGGGADNLHGGLGADVFVYSSLADSAVTAMDFIDDMIGADKFDFRLIDANVHVAGDQAFHLVGAFTHHEAELVLSYEAGSNQTTVMLDANGDMKADMVILVAGHLSSVAGWLM